MRKKPDPPKRRCGKKSNAYKGWRYSKVKMKELIKLGRIIQVKPGAVPAYKRYLDEMPGIKNDPAAIEIMRKCKKEFPSRPYVEKKLPIIGVKTAGECVIEYAKDVSSHRGAKLIRVACYKLYPK